MTIANIWLGVPFNLVILYSGLQNIPAELYEAAALDGANAWQRFWRITFPLLRPVSAITLLLGLIYTLKVVDIIWIMTRAARRTPPRRWPSGPTARRSATAARLRPGGGGRQPADPHRLRLRTRLHRAPAAQGGHADEALVADRASASSWRR